MKIKELKLKGTFEIELEPLCDNRGFFMRTYDNSIFKEYGIDRQWVQENHSYSKNKGTLRGLHYQLYPHAEGKLIRASSGKIFISFVDLRENSNTFGKWDSNIISESNNKSLFIPRGFALGMYTLSENATLLYKMDNYYYPDSQGVIKWDDEDIGISWPTNKPSQLSQRDIKAHSFEKFIELYGSIRV